MGKHNSQEIVQCLKLRLAWYQKAVDMSCGVIAWENGFNWPTYPGNHSGAAENIWYWRGAIAELKNTINMMEN